jgi:hypothetical protein
MSQVRRIDAHKYACNDSRRYVTAKDCLTEPEVLKVYCESHPNAVCLGGYGYFGCLPEGKNRKEFIKYDFETKTFIRADGRTVKTNETYCGRKIPTRIWRGKNYVENRIWAISRLGVPDLIDGKIILEAKGGVPSLQKVKTAFGQLVFYKEHEPSFDVAFLFPKVWLEAENLQTAFVVLKKYRIALIPVSDKQN